MSLDKFGAFEVGLVSREAIRMASLTVCERSQSKQDAEHLLMALGIIPTPDAKPIHHVVKLGPETTRKRSRTKS